MNLTFSYNWLKEHVSYRGKSEELARLLSLSGVSVERLRIFAQEWNRIVVGEIKKLSKHPGADKLTLVDVSIGKEQVRVVCGGSNLQAGMLVVLALPGARVRWHGEGEKVELIETSIRGEKSFGMICASNEIGLGELLPDPDRVILDLTWTRAKAGTSLAQALCNNDVWFEVEVTTNRPDALAIVGLAREAAAVTKTKTVDESLYKPRGKNNSSLPFTIKVKELKLCSRFQARVLDNVKVGQSPWWMKWRLAAAGIRPINNLVDITNYVMLEYAQPMHVYDYDTVKGKRLEIRSARASEKLLALNGVTYELSPQTLVVADAERPVGIAGIMGGEETGVRENTTRVVLEAANWDPLCVRKMSRALNLRSDAVERFEKGLLPEATESAMARAIELVQELAGGQLAGPAIDEWRGAKTKVKTIVLDPNYTNQVVGVEISAAVQAGILKRLGFRIQDSGFRIRVSVPYWRAMDVEYGYDLVEEVARVFGYNNVPSVIPQGGLTGRAPSLELQLERRIKEYFKGTGFTEVYPYSLVSEKLLEQFGLSKAPVLKVSNPLSEEYACLRSSLLPSLTQIASENQKEFSSGSIFEIAKQYHEADSDSFEEKRLAAAVWGEGNTELFYSLKGALEMLAKTLHSEIFFAPSAESFYHPGRQAKIIMGEEVVGTLGELHPVIAERFGLARRLVLADLSFVLVVRQARLIPAYTSSSVFPSVKRDLALVVDGKVAYAELVGALKQADLLLKSVELFDVYRGKNIETGKKSLAFHLLFWHEERTLKAEEVEQVMGRITAMLKQKFNAVVRD